MPATPEIHIDFSSRDNGIVISISIVQWLFEYINILFVHLYMHAILGYSPLMDKLFGLYKIGSLMVVEPCFYLKGDETFRRNWANLGFIEAMKQAFL